MIDRRMRTKATRKMFLCLPLRGLCARERRTCRPHPPQPSRADPRGNRRTLSYSTSTFIILPLGIAVQEHPSLSQRLHQLEVPPLAPALLLLHTLLPSKLLSSFGMRPKALGTQLPKTRDKQRCARCVCAASLCDKVCNAQLQGGVDVRLTVESVEAIKTSLHGQDVEKSGGDQKWWR